MGRRNIKYWGRMCLEYTGVSMGIALALLVFLAGGWLMPQEGGIQQGICVLYPVYLVLSGIFVLAIGAITNFQTYMPVLISLNATRKESLLGVLGYTAGCAAAITGVIAVVWMMPSSEVENVPELLAAVMGILLIFGSIGVLAGAVAGRFGKKGKVFTIIFCAVCGGGFGGTASALPQKSDNALLEFLMNFRPLWALALGVVLYLLAGAAAMMLIRKIEARA